jgi:hypothetical protein
MHTEFWFEYLKGRHGLENLDLHKEENITRRMDFKGRGW